jgi:hypothetical protein
MTLSGTVHGQRWLGNNDLLYNEMTQVVRHLNLQHLERVEELACPFADTIGGCDPNSNGTHLSLAMLHKEAHAQGPAAL